MWAPIALFSGQSDAKPSLQHRFPITELLLASSEKGVVTQDDDGVHDSTTEHEKEY